MGQIANPKSLAVTASYVWSSPPTPGFEAALLEDGTAALPALQFVAAV